MTTATLKIKRIVNVVDTRTYEEGPDDKFHPIPGSGTINQCYRCGRDHEVHATVELTDRTSATVGTGCMKADDKFHKTLRSAAMTAKTIARLRAELAAADNYTAARYVATKVAMDLDAPAVTIEEMSKPDGWFTTICGSEAVFSPNWERANERKDEAVFEWRTKQVNNVCPLQNVSPRSILRKLEQAKARLEMVTATFDAFDR